MLKGGVPSGGGGGFGGGFSGYEGGGGYHSAGFGGGGTEHVLVQDEYGREYWQEVPAGYHSGGWEEF
jgi:hypothetical protein